MKLQDQTLSLLDRAATNKRVGKVGLPAWQVRDREVKTRLSEPDQLAVSAIAASADAPISVYAYSNIIRAAREDLAANPQLCAAIREQYKLRNIPAPEWLQDLL